MTLARHPCTRSLCAPSGQAIRGRPGGLPRGGARSQNSQLRDSQDIKDPGHKPRVLMIKMSVPPVSWIVAVFLPGIEVLSLGALDLALLASLCPLFIQHRDVVRLRHTESKFAHRRSALRISTPVHHEAFATTELPQFVRIDRELVLHPLRPGIGELF